MPYKYIGRTTDFKGKSLWEILGNLKNFGVNRIVARNRFQRYPESCYTKILKVESLPNVKTSSYDEKRKIIVLAEKTFRGVKQENLVQLESATYKSDYFLIPKYKEAEFCKNTEVPAVKILPNKMEFPPIIKEYIIRQMKARGIVVKEEPKMNIVYNQKGFKFYKVAKEGETPTEVEPSIGLGKPAYPSLYANIKE